MYWNLAARNQSRLCVTVARRVLHRSVCYDPWGVWKGVWRCLLKLTFKAYKKQKKSRKSAILQIPQSASFTFLLYYKPKSKLFFKKLVGSQGHSQTWTYGLSDHWTGNMSCPLPYCPWHSGACFSYRPQRPASPGLYQIMHMKALWGISTMEQNLAQQESTW